MNTDKPDNIFNYNFSDLENISFEKIQMMKKIRKAMKYSYVYDIDHEGTGDEYIYFSSQPGSTIEDVLTDRVEKIKGGYLSFFKKISYGSKYDISELETNNKGKVKVGLKAGLFGHSAGIQLEGDRKEERLKENKVKSNCDIYIYKIGGKRKKSQVKGQVELLCLGVDWKSMIDNNKKPEAKKVKVDKIQKGYQNVEVPVWLGGFLRFMGLDNKLE